MHTARLETFLDSDRLGRRIVIRMPIIAIMTNISINVNEDFFMFYTLVFI